MHKTTGFASKIEPQIMSKHTRNLKPKHFQAISLPSTVKQLAKAFSYAIGDGSKKKAKIDICRDYPQRGRIWGLVWSPQGPHLLNGVEAGDSSLPRGVYIYIYIYIYRHTNL